MQRSSVLAGAVLTVGLAAAGVVSPATSNATCASFSGINIGSGCTSSLFGLAIGLGDGAIAQAGLFGAAFSFGTDAEASSGGALDLTVAAGQTAFAQTLGGFLNAAVALGSSTDGTDYAQADAGDPKGGFANLALTLAKDSYAYAGGFYVYPDVSTEDMLGAGNIAVNLGVGNDIEAIGFLNGALGVGGAEGYINNLVVASGVFNSASSVFGDVNTVTAGNVPTAFANSAFSFAGSNNTVDAGPGPLTLAGALFTSGASVAKATPGFNINGVKVPDTATSVPAPSGAAVAEAAPEPEPSEPEPTEPDADAVAVRGAVTGRRADDSAPARAAAAPHGKRAASAPSARSAAASRR